MPPVPPLLKRFPDRDVAISGDRTNAAARPCSTAEPVSIDEGADPLKSRPAGARLLQHEIKATSDIADHPSREG